MRCCSSYVPGLWNASTIQSTIRKLSSRTSGGIPSGTHIGVADEPQLKRCRNLASIYCANLSVLSNILSAGASMTEIAGMLPLEYPYIIDIYINDISALLICHHCANVISPPPLFYLKRIFWQDYIR
jgi:hypothetical protein